MQATSVSDASSKHAGPKAVINLDWTRDPPPAHLTPYQQFVRDIDWSATSFGPISTWGRELRQVVLMMMAEVHPVILYWGDDCSMIYNEAYIPLVGRKHPNQMGKSAPKVFPEFWNIFDSIISEQRLTGQTRVGEASLCPLSRNGYVEEAYFDWMLIPVIGDDGTMLGAYGRPNESSVEVIQARRVECTRNLSKKLPDTRTLPELWQCTLAALEVNEKDIPVAMLYSTGRRLSTTSMSLETVPNFYLEGVVGIPAMHRSLVSQIDPEEKCTGVGSLIQRACTGEGLVEIDESDADFHEIARAFSDLTWRGFGEPSRQYVAVAIRTGNAASAVLIVGLNPCQRLESRYRRFLSVLADVISPQVSRIRLAEEVEQRAEAARQAAREFQRSEMKFALFAKRSPVGMVLTDVNGKVYFANDAWLNFTGLTQADVEISNWIDTVYDDDVAMIGDFWRNLQTTKEGATFQVRSKVPFHRDQMRSDHRTAICAIYPDLDEKGEVFTVMGLVLDISEQKWVEEQLRLRQRELEKSEAKYRNFAERSPHGVVRTDANGYVIFANASWLNFYGFETDKFEDAQPWVSHLDEEDRPKALEFFDNVKSSKEPLTVEVRQKRRPDYSYPQLRELWLLATGWVEHGADGAIESIVFWVTDITAQKIAAKVMEDKMDEAIRLKTQQERFIDMISHEIRNPLSAILHCGEDIVESMKRCLTAMDPLPRPDTLPPKEGFLQTLTRDNVNNALDAANTIMYCVQHQKQIVDDVLTLSKLDSDLLLVTPVPVQPTELLHSVLRIFEAEAKSLDVQLTIEDTATLQEMNIEWIMLDPNRFLQVVINLVTNAIKFTRNSEIRKVTISVCARSSKPPPTFNGVTYVPQRTSAGSNSHIIQDSNQDAISDDELYLCFRVTDTGKGLSDSERKLLFNRFAQGSPKTHTEYGGSGLGLFISRQITEMLGGEIGVGATPEGGCVFAFYVRTRRVLPPRKNSDVMQMHSYSKAHIRRLSTAGAEILEVQPPLKMAERPQTPNSPDTLSSPSSAQQQRQQQQQQQPPAPAPHPPLPPRKRKVLVVEDNLINQRVLCKQLRNRKFEVEAANHGQEALDVLHRHLDEPQISPSRLNGHFDVILCDIEMPVMDGIQCVTEIRHQESLGLLPGYVPIIGVTANVRSKQVSTAIEVGMDGVTTKPYRIDELIAHIDRVCAAADTNM